MGEWTWQAALSIVLWAWTIYLAAVPLVALLGWIHRIWLNQKAVYLRDRAVDRYRTLDSSSGTSNPSP